jgi:plastocyanin
MPLWLKSAFLILPLLAIGSIALVACGGDSNDSNASSPTQVPTRAAASPTSAAAAASPTSAASANPTAASGGAANNITIADYSYSPARFNARAGQAVRLTVTNGGNVDHTFTVDGVVNSGTLAAGANKVIEFTPSQAGTLVYYCMIHGRATMSGQITVAGTSGALPPENPSGGQATGGSSGSGSGSSDSQSSPPAGYDYGY